MQNLSESEYRALIQKSMRRIESAFEGVDPDLAECEESMGSLTIQIPGHGRCILSAQPSVRQLWLALASKGIAIHFNYDSKSGKWIDDRGQNLELMAFLEKFFLDTLKMKVRLTPSE
jgi:iron donor protein CyaY